jgi:exosortase/archaeosortase family protein
MIHNLLLLGVIFVLLHAANLTEVLSYLSRPLVTGVATAFGIEAVNRGTDILLGDLVLPWTQDCSGVNTLIILWGVTLWANRQRPFDRNLVVRLFLCVPAALIANMLRILTLAGYRYVFYPNWESEELHYLVGFLWLVPFLFLFVEDLRRMDRARWIEVVYLSLVLALVAPAIFSPGGSLVALSTLFFLAHSRVADPAPPRLTAAYLAWGAAALLIAWSSMESLWIPWLLVCPRLVSWKLLSSWTGVTILSGTVSLLAMRPEWQIVVGAALAYRIFRMFRTGAQPQSGSASAPPKAPEIAALVLLGIAPFALPAVIGIEHPVERPPDRAMTKQLTFNSYQISLTGQPVDVRMYWYGAFGDGRHHSLASCMRFRGLILEPVTGQEEVQTGGNMWMRDFFIHEGELKSSYGDYLLASFSPFAAPGIHIILDAPADSMSAAYFSRQSEKLAARLFAAYEEQSPAAERSERKLAGTYD